jgi:predicted RNA binding protein YcfA (HicA-like mRNA interferase family)
MKRRLFEKRMRAAGWHLLRRGGKHDVWTNADETKQEYVPRHGEINEHLARAIIKNVEEG